MPTCESRRTTVLPGRDNVVGVVRGRDPSRRVVLEAHMDVVSTAGMTIPPFDPVIDGGRMYGRGSCDTKAGLAGMLHAVADLAARVRAELQGPGPVEQRYAI